MKNKTMQRVQVIIAVLSALSGFLIQPLIENLGGEYFTSPEKFVLIVSVFGGVILILSLVGFAMLFNESIKMQKEVLSSTDDLVKRFGVSVRLLAYGSKNEYSTTFELPTRLIESAKEEILILDYLSLPGSFELQSTTSKDLQSWYLCLEKACTRGVAYKRIVQIQDGATDVLDRSIVGDTAMIRHFEKIVKMHDNESMAHVSLKTSRVFLPEVSIVVIDSRYVFWEIPSLTGDGKFRFDLDLFINDANGEFVKDLKNYFNKIEARSSTVVRLV